MKLRKFTCLILTLALLFCFVACQEPTEEERTDDFEASVSMLEENMDVDRKSAIHILEVLCSLGLDARIDSIYSAEDKDGVTFYKVWFGLNLFQVYIKDGEVASVHKFGELIYPKPVDTDPADPDQSKPSDDDQNQNPTHKIELIVMTSRVRAGDTASIEVVGLPETLYEIIVKYSSGASTAKGLEPKLSDVDGHVSWTWKVSSNVAPGKYSIEIISGNSSYKTSFVVE
jgi:hypothetical protein